MLPDVSRTVLSPCCSTWAQHVPHSLCLLLSPRMCEDPTLPLYLQQMASRLSAQPSLISTPQRQASIWTAPPQKPFLAPHCLRIAVQLLHPAFKAQLSRVASAPIPLHAPSSHEQSVPCPSGTLAGVPFLDEILTQFEERNSLPESPQQVLGASLSVG